ncbi:MAG: hypothetical protein KA004_04925 [Verrucomicrobiales bacterium]|nr:hypothetical protein [Verrucomicrobiales bacterium]
MRILAIRGGALGDFLVALPALAALRRHWSPVRLELLTRPAYGALACHFGAADAFRSLDSAGAAWLFSGEGTPNADWQDWLHGFDQVVAWMTDADGCLQRNLARCCPGTVRLLPPLPSSTVLPAARQLALGLGLSVSPFIRTPVRKQHNSRLVAVHPGSGSFQKNWPVEKWAQLVIQLAGRIDGLRFLLITGEADEHAAQVLPQALRSSAVPFMHHHHAPLAQLADLLAATGLFLGHDSGISHLAAACGIPCRLLFGSSNSAVWAPLGRDVRILQAPQGNLNLVSTEAVLDFAAECLINTARHESEHCS